MSAPDRVPNATDIADMTLTDRVIVMPWKRFRRAAASGGIVLCLTAIVALIWANSPWASSYQTLFHELDLTIGFGTFAMSHHLAHWINDALMGMFFLLVGMEIKREVLFGDLRDPRRAALPLAAAAGGMLIPAGVYLAINAPAAAAGVEHAIVRGWGVPMATDIAFALGILALAGTRVPSVLRVFLCTLAIVDDLGALLVIAIFYTDHLNLEMLGWSAGVFAIMFAAARLRIREPRVYVFAGAVLLICLGQSGVHPTIAGVLVATQIPASARVDPRSFLRSARAALDYFEHQTRNLRHGLDQPIMSHLSTAQIAAARSVGMSARHMRPPMQRIEQHLQPWITFGVLPLFALANAGVHLPANPSELLFTASTIGIAAGLMIGKPVGIMLACWLLVKAGLGKLPTGVSWMQMLGVSVLGGIGFTMAIFITNLAFPAAPVAVDGAKLAILAASAVSAAVGLTILLSQPKTVGAKTVEEHEDEIDLLIEPESEPATPHTASAG
ncbi:MAG: Na+/H+ antiporter NhaA [Planctomycetota bacterium]